MPRTGGRSRMCERCGSTSHPETTCHTLWRQYTYYTPSEYEEARAKKARHEKRRELAHQAREQKRQKSTERGWSVSLAIPEDDAGPSDDTDSDSAQETVGRPPPADWDPVMRVCYNCAARNHHWGDDCFLRRTNPTRPTGDPSPFSEVMANTGPYGSRSRNQPRPPPPIPKSRMRRSMPARPSLLDDMQDDDENEWLARHQKLRGQTAALFDTDDDELTQREPRMRHRLPLPHRKRAHAPRRRDRPLPPPPTRRAFQPRYRGGYS